MENIIKLRNALQTSPGELKRLEVDYRFSHMSSIMNPLSMEFLNEIEAYSLVSPLYPIVDKFPVSDEDAYHIKEMLLEKLSTEERERMQEFLDSIKWLKIFSNASSNVKAQLMDCLPIREEQIEISQENDIKKMIVIIPNKGVNAHLIKKALNGFGYRPYSEESVDMGTETSWIRIEFVQ